MSGTRWCSAALIYWALILPMLLSTVVTQSSPNAASDDDNLMIWHEARDARALCNDFSRAGFFMRRNTSSNKWIIFLESGSLCFSSETCNRRFFRTEFRPRSAPSLDKPFGRFNPAQLFNSLRNRVPYRDYVNPLMTSMKCLDRSLFNLTRNGTIAVEGRDILSPYKSDNEDFYSHNHVLIPFCSSDLWLVESEGRNDSVENVDCDIFNGYVPDSSDLQFAFRGRIIFQSIFQQLMDDHGMSTASSILLGGSSAGGVGAINLVQWVQKVIPPMVELQLLVDSAWFINFQDNIARTFEENTRIKFPRSGNGQTDRDRLVQSLYSHPACNDTTFGYPCCFSSQCILTQRNASGQLAYFPEGGVKMFFINSMYDIFLLAPSLLGRDNLNMTNEANQTEVLFNFLILVGEYGGQISSSINRTYSLEPSFTYFLTQCFQHIYLATSSLWGSGPGAIFSNTSSVGFTDTLATFRHTIEPGRWNLPLANGYSIRKAIRYWYNNLSQSDQKQFLDSCEGPYCNEECPESFTLGELTSNNWPIGVKIVIAIIIVAIGMVCMFMKFLFKIWLFWLEKKQDNYLDSLDVDLETGESYLAFPECDDEDAIAVSCLDLNYSISFKTSKKVKDERTDKTTAIVLNELEEQHKSSKSFNRSTVVRRSSRPLHRRSRFVKKESLFKALKRPSLLDLEENGIEMSSNTLPMVSKDEPHIPLPEVEVTIEDPESTFCGIQRTTTKQILKDISMYFNPGEMIGIMGPSGCGKTTFMDLLTGRRKTGMQTGDIYVNGIPLEEIRDWYVANTGYVLQLARPFYEELTVRDNLTLAAEIKLPVSSKFTTKEKFKRVEQVLEVTGLSRLADTVVGGETGPGLSGGQKRRLVVALQLLQLPSIIFLDEPTSGLDATSSMELLSHLNKLAHSNRTVILTIHQPRLEIFHMFHKLVLLSDGKVAYHGAPEKSYEVFVTALTTRYLEHGLIIPSLEDHNPADVVMDMLGNPRIRQVLTEYYQESEEPKLVRRAIKIARFQQFSQTQSSMESLGSAFELAIHGARKVGKRHANIFVRMATLEARAEKRLSSVQILFLPVIFLLYGLVLGTVYFQQERGFLVISGMCVFAVASGIFVFPAIEPYYRPAIQIYNYERADGVGRSQDLVFQGFIRYVTVAFIPVVGSTTLAYFLLVNRAAYDPLVFLQVVLVNLCLNFTWTALLIALLVSVPNIAFRLSSLIASVAGFTSGFFIPINNINWAYRWIAFINPNYYGLSSVAFLILEDYNLCSGNQLICYLDSGAFTLRQFFFDEVNPYLHIVILLGFTLFFLCVGVFANWVKHTSAGTRIKRIFSVITNEPVDEIFKQIREDKESFERSLSTDPILEDNEEIGYDESLSDDEASSADNNSTASVDSIPQGDEKLEDSKIEVKSASKGQEEELPEEQLTSQVHANGSISQESTEHGPKESNWKKIRKVRLIDQRSPTGSFKKKPTSIKFRSSNQSFKRKTTLTPFLRVGESHSVWLPKKRSRMSDVVEMLKNQGGSESSASKTGNESEVLTAASSSPRAPTTPKVDSLQTRQQMLLNRVLATQAVLKESTDKLLKEEEEITKLPKHISLLEASKKVTSTIKNQKRSSDKNDDFSDIVSQYITKAKTEKKSPIGNVENGSSAWSRATKSLAQQQLRPHLHNSRRKTKGAIPISTFRELVKEARLQSMESSDSNKPSQRSSAGPSKNLADSPSADSPSLTLDPPPTHGPKLSKVSNLKMAVARRQIQHQEGEEELGRQVLSDMADTDPASSSQEMSSNVNNSNNKNDAFISEQSASPCVESNTTSPHTPLSVSSSYQLPAQKCQENDMEGN